MTAPRPGPALRPGPAPRHGPDGAPAVRAVSAPAHPGGPHDDAPHVAVVNVFFAPNTYGGATVVAEEVARHLVRDHGVRVSAISAVCRDDLAPYAVVRAEVDGIASWLINLPAHRDYLDGYLNPRVAERVARILDRIEPDLVHVHCIQDLGADLIEAARGAGLPVILSVHDFWWLCERQFMIRPDGAYCAQHPVRIAACRGCVDDHARAEARAARLARIGAAADLVTYPSRFALDLSEASGFAPGRGAVWRNGVRPPGEDFFAAQAARRAADPRPVFAFVGGPSRIKGWPLVHDTFAGLDRDDFAGVLVDGSRDGSWWRDRDISRLRGDWRVVPRYDQAGMDAFWAGVDALLFTSQWKETFGLTIREALARGVRVIQTDSGGTMEHAARDRVMTLAIGDGPEVLRTLVARVLDAPDDHPAPIPVETQSDQARAFLDLAAPLVPALARRARAAA